MRGKGKEKPPLTEEDKAWWNKQREEMGRPSCHRIMWKAFEILERYNKGCPPNVVGITALDLSKSARVSKEWARIILRDLEGAGRLYSKTHGQVKVYYIKN